LHAEPLLHPEPQGVIWTALVLDYPGHSFSHLGLFFEGTNARLPNQDLSNSAWVISHSMGVPWVLYDHKDEDAFRVPSALSEIFGHDMNEYSRRARNIVRHLSYQAVGEPSGVHGLFHKYRIDAVTLYALPARGPHGFYSLGRVVESLLRTSNNLLERLHASFFFYLFTAPGEFAEFARYLPPVIILGLAVSFGGLRMFVQTGWIPKRVPSTEKQPQRSLVWAMRDRPVLEVACIMASTYLVGVGTFSIVSSKWTWAELKNSKLKEVIFVSSAPSIALLVGIFVYSRVTTSHRLPPTTPALLKAFNLCSLGVVISVIAVANFSLSASVAVLAALPLCLVPVSLHQNHEGYKHGLTAVFVVRRAFALLWLLTISPPGLLIVAQMLEQNVAGSNGTRVLMWLRRMLWESVILKTWFLPLVSTIYLPHILQGLIVCILPL
ncbi:Glycosyl phosphatidyl inositol protein transamidase complex subunit, partial [Serendipita sp. 398]